MHGRQGSSLAVLHQRAFRDRGFTNAAADRGGHLSVGQIDARGFNCGFSGDDGSVALLGRGYGSIVILLANVLSA